MIRNNFESLPSIYLGAVLVYIITLQYTEIQLPGKDVDAVDYEDHH